ncbi:MAG TPA: hypothetical protein VI792_03665, partial [Candidatus Eisenbacteria bacterium]
GLTPPSPNLLVAATAVGLALDRPARLSVRRFGLEGRRVRVLEDRELPAGLRRWTRDGRYDRGTEAGSGIVYVEALADGARSVRAVVELRWFSFARPDFPRPRSRWDGAAALGDVPRPPGAPTHARACEKCGRKRASCTMPCYACAQSCVGCARPGSGAPG